MYIYIYSIYLCLDRICNSALPRTSLANQPSGLLPTRNRIITLNQGCGSGQRLSRSGSKPWKYRPGPDKLFSLKFIDPNYLLKKKSIIYLAILWAYALQSLGSMHIARANLFIDLSITTPLLPAPHRYLTRWWLIKCCARTFAVLHPSRHLFTLD